MKREHEIEKDKTQPLLNISGEEGIYDLMESTMTEDNRIIAIIPAILLLLMFMLFFHTHDFTTTTIPAVEVMQWSSDTCWVSGWLDAFDVQPYLRE